MNKEEFIEQAKKANEEALKTASLSDLSNPYSTVYQGIKTPPKDTEIVTKKELPKTDADGTPIIPKLHTFSEDINDAVKNQNLTMTKMALAEIKKKEEKPEEKKSEPINKYKVFFLIFVSLFIIGLGLSFLYYFNQKKIEEAKLIVPVVVEKELFRIDKKEDVATFKTIPRTVFGNIQKKYTETSQKSSIDKLNFIGDENKKLTSEEFFDYFDARIPNDLRNYLLPEYMFGLVTNETKSTPFIFFSVSSDEIALPAMLEWEKNMPQDLEQIFTREVNQTSTSTALLPEFKDKIKLSRDTRAIEDENGDVFFYTIYEKRNIIITSTKDALSLILDRLREEKIKG